MLMPSRFAPRPVCRLIPSRALYPFTPSPRFKRYEAFGTGLDQDALAEARAWYQRFDESQLPSGNTTYARSSGPGGQHVNKTETKAITSYPVEKLLSKLPSSLHGAVRASKYYTASNDSLTFHAQTSRSRTSNTEENRQKLVDEVMRIYLESTPSETSDEKKKKHQEVYALSQTPIDQQLTPPANSEQKFHAARLKDKKFKSAKKASRRGPSE